MQAPGAIQSSTSGTPGRGAPTFYGSYITPLWSLFNTYRKQLNGEDCGFGGQVGRQLSNGPISHVLDEIVKNVKGVFFLSEWMANLPEKGDLEILKKYIRGEGSFKNLDRAILFIPLVVEHYLGGRHIVLLSCVKQDDAVSFLYRDSQGTSIEGNANYSCSYGKQLFKNEIEEIKNWIAQEILEKEPGNYAWDDQSIDEIEGVPFQGDIHSCGLHTMQYMFFLLDQYGFIQKEDANEEAPFYRLTEAALNFKADIESEKAFRKAIAGTLPQVPKELVDNWIEMTECPFVLKDE